MGRLGWQQLVLTAALVTIAACSFDGGIASVGPAASSPRAQLMGSPAPSQPIAVSPSTAPTATGGPRPLPKTLVCPPLADAGPNVARMDFDGACRFSEFKAVTCSHSTSVFRMNFSRTTSNGLAIQFALTVSPYTGPGTNGSGAISMTVPTGSSAYRWGLTGIALTIDGGQTSGSFPPIALRPAAGSLSQMTESVEGSFTCR